VLTVPILMVELVLVIDLPRRQAQMRAFILGVLAAEMIVLGYPGQIASDSTTRWLWWAASMVPFLIIIYQLYITLADAVRSQPEEARGLVAWARFLAVAIWCVYPVIYTLPMLGLTGTNTFIATQIAYALADVSAKVGYGVMIYMIAARKSQLAGQPSLGAVKGRLAA
jgi:bacteriorhodopsin